MNEWYKVNNDSFFKNCLTFFHDSNASCYFNRYTWHMIFISMITCYQQLFQETRSCQSIQWPPIYVNVYIRLRLFLVGKIRKWVFWIFSDNRLTFDHCAMLHKSLVTASCNCLMSVLLARLSSVNNRGIASIHTLAKIIYVNKEQYRSR